MRLLTKSEGMNVMAAFSIIKAAKEHLKKEQYDYITDEVLKEHCRVIISTNMGEEKAA